MRLVKSIRYLILTNCWLALACPKASAETLFRHIPFVTKVTSTDVVVAEYDFTNQFGIKCISTTNHEVVFSYKGQMKKVPLPVILQGYHLPQEKGEELADESGRVTLAAPKGADSSSIVFCHYY